MAEAKVIIKSENNISKGINSAKKDLQGFDSFAQTISNNLAKAFTAAAIVAGVKKLVDGAKELINEYAEAEKVALRLQKVWDNVGATTGKSYDEIMKYADAIEKSTYFTSEAVEESALLLAATESLTEDGFERALNVSADLAAALGEDMTAAASTLAKALEDPASALTRLKSIGVTFTDEEKDQIKALTDANETYEAQSIILGKIEDKYKDVAKAINNTPAGTLDNIKDTLGDIRENLGGALLDVISPALELVYKALLKISEWVSKARARAIEVKELNSLADTLKAGGSLEGFADEILYAEIDNLKKTIGSGVYELRQYDELYTSWVEILTKELEDRAEKAANALSVDSVEAVIINGIDSTVKTTVDDTLDAFDKFFKSYGSSSKGYLAETYQAVIDEAQNFMRIIQEGKDGSAASVLGLPDTTTQEDLFKYYQQLKEVVATYTDKIANLNKVEEDKKEEKDIWEEMLGQYGSLSKSFNIKNLETQIANLTELQGSANEENTVFLNEIIDTLNSQLEELKKVEKEIPEPKTFIENLKGVLGDWISSYRFESFNGTVLQNISDDQGLAAAGTLIDTALEGMGEAGEVAGRLAQNMLTMGPVLGAIVTAIQYVIEGFMEVMGPVFQDFVKYGIEPIKEIGRVIADVLMPIMDDIMPSIEQSAEFLIGIFDMLGVVLKPIVSFLSSFLTPILGIIVALLEILEEPLKLVAKGLSAVGETLGWLGDWIRHIIALVVNWLASIDILGWKPFGGLHMDDVNPGNLKERIQASWDKIDNAFVMADTEGTSTQAAVSNASYSGATSVTINIYQEAPIVGEGGMLEFAQMIRSQFETLDYYGV